LVKSLQDSNGWIRDKAQQMLIDRKMLQAEPILRELLKRKDKPIALIHALWTMEGLGVLEVEDVLPLLRQSNWHLQVQALGVLPSLINEETYTAVVPVLTEMVSEKDSLAAPTIAFLAQYIHPFNAIAAN